MFAATAADIRPIDIAHALAHECRWQGMCKRMFTVAEHSVWVARMGKEIAVHRHVNPDQVALHALLHDAHEAYLSDIPKPIKDSFESVIKEAANRIDQAIYESLGIQGPSEQVQEIVHLADQYSAWIESRTLFHPWEDEWQPGIKPDDDLEVPSHMYYDIQSPAQPDTVIRDAWLSLLGHYARLESNQF